MRMLFDDVSPLLASANAHLHGGGAPPPVRFPQPYDARHPHLPPLPPSSRLASAGNGLVTAQVLVMDLARGRSVIEISEELLGRVAACYGDTPEAHRTNERNAAIAAAARRAGAPLPSEGSGCIQPEIQGAVLAMARGMRIDCHDASHRSLHMAAAALYSSINTLSNCLPQSPCAPLPPPPPPPPPARRSAMLVDRIFEAVGHALFYSGVFNADLHAGNVIFDEATDELTFIDHAQLVSISVDERTSLAYYLIAVETCDEDLAAAAFTGLGCDATWLGALVRQPPSSSSSSHAVVPVPDASQRVASRPPPAWVCLTCASIDLGSLSQVTSGLLRYDYDIASAARLSESPLDALEACRDLMSFHRIPGTYALLQRMCMTLKGLARAVGMGDASPIAHLMPHARRWLRSEGKSMRDLAAAAGGREWQARGLDMINY